MSSHDPQSFVCMFSIDETNKTLILPLLKTGNYDCKVDWGDGQSSSIIWNPAAWMMVLPRWTCFPM